jgi:hypothetical protein
LHCLITVAMAATNDDLDDMPELESFQLNDNNNIEPVDVVATSTTMLVATVPTDDRDHTLV